MTMYCMLIGEVQWCNTKPKQKQNTDHRNEKCKILRRNSNYLALVNERIINIY